MHCSFESTSVFLLKSQNHGIYKAGSLWPRRIIKSNSWLCRRPPKKNKKHHIWKHSPIVSWIPAGLVPWPLSWGAYSSAWPPFEWRTFPWPSAWLSPVPAPCQSPLLWAEETKELQLLLMHLPFKTPEWSQLLPICLPFYILHHLCCPPLEIL